MDKNTEFKAFLSKFKEANPVLMETVEKGFIVLFEGNYSNPSNVTIKFRTDNDAFVNGPDEIVRILRKLADDMEKGNDVGIIKDINGNSIGNLIIED